MGNYLNFPGLLEEGEAQLRASFGPHFDRLVEIKTKWDPDNLFRLNHNVGRAAGEGGVAAIAPRRATGARRDERVGIETRPFGRQRQYGVERERGGRRPPPLAPRGGGSRDSGGE